MMKKSVTYTNGVIAVKETKLLRDKILRLTELSAEDAFRSVAESGFGRGAEAENVYDYEKMLVADERELDAFITEYAPSQAERAYFLAPRDFHNAKAYIKAAYLREPVDKMLAPDGEISAEKLGEYVQNGADCGLCEPLREAIDGCKAVISEGERELSGAEVGIAFDRALYKYLLSACARNAFLKRTIIKKIDMNNILSAMRSESFEIAEESFIDGGKIKREMLGAIFSDKPENALDGTDYKQFYGICLAAKQKGEPFTQAEKLLDDCESEQLRAHRFELKRSQPFIYYVLRRREENANLRIVFVCLLAGMNGREIVKRLRSV